MIAEDRMPLAGVKVLEMGSLIAGPYAGSVLAQFGAEVIKIEPPGTGDPLRKWRGLRGDTSLWWYSQSRNKKSLALDLKSDEGREVVEELCKDADILIENFRPGTLERWGLGWDDLSAINPGLIMLRISGYGQTGPRRDQPGFAAIAESFGGLRHVTGFPDRPPCRAGVSIGDTLASLYGVVGVLMALHDRQVNNGEGQVVDIALYEAVFAVMESLVPEYCDSGFVRQRSGASLPGISPSNTYECADGNYVVIAGNADSIFKRLMNAIDRSDLANDPGLAHNDGRVIRNDELDAAISDWTLQRSCDDAVALLEEAAVPVGKINTAKDIVNDPHFAARDMLETHNLPDDHPITVPGIVPKLSKTPGRTRWLGPALDAHRDEILARIEAEDGGQ